MWPQQSAGSHELSEHGGSQRTRRFPWIKRKPVPERVPEARSAAQDDFASSSKNPLTSVTSFDSISTLEAPAFAASTNTLNKETAKRVDARTTDEIQELHDGNPSPSHRRPVGRLGRRPIGLKAWANELRWIGASVFFFMLLFGIIRIFLEQPMPSLPETFSLNTIVAGLVTVCRLCLCIPVAQGLSQMKWNWFASESRPVTDLMRFDDASRGPWGAAMLLYTMRRKQLHIALLAAFVLIFGLTTSFMTQNVIKFADITQVGGPTYETENGRSTRFPPPVTNTEGSQNDIQIMNNIQRSAFQGVFADVRKPLPDPGFECAFAGCSYPNFTSLGACSTISNVTSLLNITKSKGSDGKTEAVASLMDGRAVLRERLEGDSSRALSITSLAAKNGANDTSNPGGSYTYPLDRDSLGHWNNSDLLPATFSQMIFIFTNPNAASGDIDHSYRAVEVLWHMCVRSYYAGVENHVPYSDVSRTSVEIASTTKAPEDAKTGSFELISSDDEKASYKVWAGWQFARLGEYFGRAFSGNFTDRDDKEDDGDSRNSVINIQFGNNLYSASNNSMTVKEVDGQMWQNLQLMTGNIAQSMTINFRQTEHGSQDGGIQGSTSIPVTIVQVRWEWLTPLAVQIIATMIFMIFVIKETSDLEMAVVKSCNFAELFAFESHEDRQRGHVSSLPGGGIETRPREEVKVKLVREGYKWKLDVTDRGGPAIARHDAG